MDALTDNDAVLVGLLIDVSGSMANSIRNSSTSQTRLESFRDALEKLVQKYADANDSREHSGRAKLFAYGFGFGNILAEILGKKGPAVRDLFVLPGSAGSTVDVNTLAKEWPRYRSHVEDLASQMFGSTPMQEGLIAIQGRFKSEARHMTRNQILFFLSDGEPDSGRERIEEIAAALKKDQIFIVSCFVTDQDIAEPRHIYGRPLEQWPSSAKLMFECASVIDVMSPFYSYLKEYGWKIDDGGRMFTQINQSELLAEFMNAVLSPLTETPSSTDQDEPRARLELKSNTQSQTDCDLGTNTASGKPEPATGRSVALLQNGRTVQTDVDQVNRHIDRTNWPAWVFGGILILFFMCIVWFKPQAQYNPAQEKLIKILASAFVGVFSAFFAGALRLEGKVPLLKDAQIGTIGGFAGFCLTFFLW